MKYLLSALILLGSLQLNAQSATCMDHHDGDFEVVVDGEVIATIARSGGEQIEYSVVDNTIIIYSVVWVNDCTQELRLKEAVQAKEDQVYISKEDVVTVKMDDVSADAYKVHITMKGTDTDIRGQMRVAAKK
jgi:hypothetical protein